MNLPTDDPSFQVVAIGGGIIAALKLATVMWKAWLDAKGDSRDDREGHQVELGYRQLIEDLRKDNDRLNSIVERQSGALLERDKSIEMLREQVIELENKLYRKKP